MFYLFYSLVLILFCMSSKSPNFIHQNYLKNNVISSHLFKIHSHKIAQFLGKQLESWLISGHPNKYQFSLGTASIVFD